MKTISRKTTPTIRPESPRVQKEFGFSSSFIKGVATHLDPAIQHVFQGFFSQGCHGSLLDPHDIPGQLEKKPMLEILNPKYFWRDFIHHPDIVTALREDAEFDYWENLLLAPYLLKNEEKLLLDWQTQRYSYYQFAHNNTATWLQQYEHRSSELRQRLQLCRMSAFRFLDGALTGRQTLDPHPPFGGEDGLECRLLAPEGQNRITKFLRIGIVKRAEYGTSYRNSDQQLLEAVYAETDTAAPNFYPGNCIAQVTQLLAPLLQLVAQSHLPDELISELIDASLKYQEINASSPLPESELQTHRLRLGKLQHLEQRFSKAWFTQHSVSPLWLDLTGFRPNRNLKLRPILEDLNQRYREVVGLDRTPDSLLVWRRTRQVILLPILNRCIQLRCLQLYQELDPTGYTETLENSQQAIDSQLSDREQLLQQLQYCVEASSTYLVANAQGVLSLLGNESHTAPPVYLISRSTENGY